MTLVGLSGQVPKRILRFRKGTLLPAPYVCPISLRIMDDPVVDPDDAEGRACSQAALEEFLCIHGVRPLTGLPSTSSWASLPNLKDAIELFMVKEGVVEEAMGQPVKRLRLDCGAQALQTGLTIALNILTDEIPAAFFCPLSWQLMRDPVFDVRSSCAVSCERSAVQQHLAEYNVNPITGGTLELSDLRPDQNLRAAITLWLRKHTRPHSTPPRPVSMTQPSADEAAALLAPATIAAPSPKQSLRVASNGGQEAGQGGAAANEPAVESLRLQGLGTLAAATMTTTVVADDVLQPSAAEAEASQGFGAHAVKGGSQHTTQHTTQQQPSVCLPPSPQQQQRIWSSEPPPSQQPGHSGISPQQHAQLQCSCTEAATVADPQNLAHALRCPRTSMKVQIPERIIPETVAPVEFTPVKFEPDSSNCTPPGPDVMHPSEPCNAANLQKPCSRAKDRVPGAADLERMTPGSAAEGRPLPVMDLAARMAAATATSSALRVVGSVLCGSAGGSRDADDCSGGCWNVSGRRRARVSSGWRPVCHGNRERKSVTASMMPTMDKVMTAVPEVAGVASAPSAAAVPGYLEGLGSGVVRQDCSVGGMAAAAGDAVVAVASAAARSTAVLVTCAPGIADCSPPANFPVAKPSMPPQLPNPHDARLPPLTPISVPAMTVDDRQLKVEPSVAVRTGPCSVSTEAAVVHAVHSTDSGGGGSAGTHSNDVGGKRYRLSTCQTHRQAAAGGPRLSWILPTKPTATRSATAAETHRLPSTGCVAMARGGWDEGAWDANARVEDCPPEASCGPDVWRPAGTIPQGGQASALQVDCNRGGRGGPDDHPRKRPRGWSVIPESVSFPSVDTAAGKGLNAAGTTLATVMIQQRHQQHHNHQEHGMKRRSHGAANLGGSASGASGNGFAGGAVATPVILPLAATGAIALTLCRKYLTARQRPGPHHRVSRAPARHATTNPKQAALPREAPSDVPAQAGQQGARSTEVGDVLPLTGSGKSSRANGHKKGKLDTFAATLTRGATRTAASPVTCQVVAVETQAECDLSKTSRIKRVVGVPTGGRGTGEREAKVVLDDKLLPGHHTANPVLNMEGCYHSMKETLRRLPLGG